jgi:hypothetical protein
MHLYLNVYPCNRSIPEAEEEGLQVWGHPGQHNVNLSQITAARTIKQKSIHVIIGNSLQVIS